MVNEFDILGDVYHYLKDSEPCQSRHRSGKQDRTKDR